MRIIRRESACIHRMARRQKRKAANTAPSELATAVDCSPSQTPGLKYIPKFKKAKLKATEDTCTVELEQDAPACLNPNCDIENTPTLEDSEHFAHTDPKHGSPSNTGHGSITTAINGGAASGMSHSDTCLIPQTMEQNLDLVDHEGKDTITLQTLPHDEVTNCFEVVPIPPSKEENEAVLPHTPQKPELPPSDTQSLYEHTSLCKQVLFPMVATMVTSVGKTDAISPSNHNHTYKSSDDKVTSLSNADTVVPQVEEACVPTFSGSNDPFQAPLGHTKVDAGTEALQGLIDELSSLNQFIMCRKRELETAKRQRNAWLKIQKHHLNKEVR